MESWQSQLADGHSQAAWDLFIERYRRLILATIRRLIPDHDDGMDVFSRLCEALAADDFARLRRYTATSEKQASVSTWLVVVVRNLTIDWLRARDGRPRPGIPASLNAVQREIFIALCGERRSHIEAYELIRTRSGVSMPFHLFLREVRATQRLAPCPGESGARTPERDGALDEIEAPAMDPVEAGELARRISAAMSSLPPDVRLAVELFLVEQMPAADVARVVGWSSPKTVYNRVYRALATLRQDLVRSGIRPGDL